MFKRKENLIWILTFVFAFLFNNGVYAQAGSGGKLSVLENGFVSVFGAHNFYKGSGLIAAGKVKTCRTGAKGYVNFIKGSSWSGASKEQYIDGYVKVYHNDPFVFPIGQNNKYRPIAISGAAHTSAAYFDKSPADITRISDPILTESSREEVLEDRLIIDRVSNKEYWDITGDQLTNITFLWNETSNIANITGGDLEKLQLVGWKNGNWQIVPSQVESTIDDKFGASTLNMANASGFSSGAITTISKVVPNDYEYFAFGAVEEAPDSEDRDGNEYAGLLSVYPNPVQSDVYLDLKQLNGKKGTIQVLNLYGQLIEERAYDGTTNEVVHFDTSDYENGIYKLYINIDRTKQVTSKFVVHRLY